MTKYTAGFLFDPTKTMVILIKKNKPKFLKGKYTAVGGHVEIGESSREAIIREFKEEAGILIEDWNYFCTLKGTDFAIDWYWATSEYYELVESVTDEEIVVLAVDEVDGWNLSNNASWLLKMALSMENDRASAFQIQELY